MSGLVQLIVRYTEPVVYEKHPPGPDGKMNDPDRRAAARDLARIDEEIGLHEERLRFLRSAQEIQRKRLETGRFER